MNCCQYKIRCLVPPALWSKISFKYHYSKWEYPLAFYESVSFLYNESSLYFIDFSLLPGAWFHLKKPPENQKGSWVEIQAKGKLTKSINFFQWFLSVLNPLVLWKISPSGVILFQELYKLVWLQAKLYFASQCVLKIHIFQEYQFMSTVTSTAYADTCTRSRG